MANERRCLICGQAYTFCPKCPSGSHLPSWMHIYDKEECKNIFNICSSYKNGYLSKDDASARLKNISLPQRLNDEYQKLVDEINFVEKKPSKRKKREIEEEIQTDYEQTEEVVNEELI